MATSIDAIIISTVSGVASLSGKVYPHEALKDAAAPFCFYLQEAGDEERALDGLTGLKGADYQVHVVAGTHLAMQTLGGAVMAALQALEGTEHDEITIQAAECRQTQPNFYESGVGLWRKPLYLHLDYLIN